MQAAGGNPRTLLLDARRAEETWSLHGRSRGVPSTGPWCGTLRIPQPGRPRVLLPFVLGIGPSADRCGMQCTSDPQT